MRLLPVPPIQIQGPADRSGSMPILLSAGRYGIANKIPATDWEGFLGYMKAQALSSLKKQEDNIYVFNAQEQIAEAIELF
jgi:hypothetical protein